jgi:EmrB/QacA subfamily drug resistance transporter
MDGDTAPATTESYPSRWSALLVLSLCVLMVVLDGTVVNVALPSIRTDLGFTDLSAVWILNAYMLTFGGALLVSGRMGDLYGHRRLLLGGIALFTSASLVCGVAPTATVLVCARAIQGLGAAIVMAVSLPLITELFPDEAERARAMGVYGAVCAAGGSCGLLLGGLLTSALSWRWVFLINLPICIVLYVRCTSALPALTGRGSRERPDLWGAVTITAALACAMLFVSHEGPTDSGTEIALVFGAAGLLAVFLLVEARVATPLLPLRILTAPDLLAANTVRVLWAAGLAPWFFLSAQYIQIVLGYDALFAALAFLPVNVITAGFSLGLSARLIGRFGVRRILCMGLLLSAAGFMMLARVRVEGSIATDMLPGMIVLALGSGAAFSPILLATMHGVSTKESGLVSGISSTLSILGSAMGLAILVRLADSHRLARLAEGASNAVALTGSYRYVFMLSAACFVAAAVIAALFVRLGIPRET